MRNAIGVMPKDYVEAMWLMLQQDQPEDFVIATGVTTSVRDFIKMAFSEVGIDLEFEGQGKNEIARVVRCHAPDYFITPGEIVLAVDPTYFRPTEVEHLIGDATKAREKLGWQPNYSVRDIVKEMMKSDLKLFERDKILISNGQEILKYDEL